MKKGLTELVYILDKSGSMSGCEADTIGGFNAMIEAQKDVEGEALVSLVLFSHHSEVVYDRVNLNDVQPLTSKEYYVGGNTALIDAIGDAIHHIKNVHKYAREEDVPQKTIFVINTDGYENASRCWSSDQVKKMIAEQQEKGWDFMFLGADIDAVESGGSVGMRRGRCVNYNRENARAMSMYTSCQIDKLRNGKNADDDMNVSYSVLSAYEMKQMEELSRELEQQAYKKAQNTSDENK